MTSPKSPATARLSSRIGAVGSKTARSSALVALAVCAGWLAGRASGAGAAAHAQEQAVPPPLQRLLIEDEIRQKIALYGFYADGDGAGGRPKDLRTLADTLMTPDVVSEIHPANGSAPIILRGREVVAKSPAEVDPDRARRIAGRHYLVSTVFDEVGSDLARTRTTAVYFDATRNLIGPGCRDRAGADCGGAPIRTVMWTYQMTWRRTPEGWQIAHNTLRDDD